MVIYIYLLHFYINVLKNIYFWTFTCIIIHTVCVLICKCIGVNYIWFCVFTHIFVRLILNTIYNYETFGTERVATVIAGLEVPHMHHRE